MQYQEKSGIYYGVYVRYVEGYLQWNVLNLIFGNPKKNNNYLVTERVAYNGVVDEGHEK